MVFPSLHRFVSLACMLGLLLPVSGQSTLDSLKHQLLSLPDDFNKCDLLKELSVAYNSVDLDSSMHYGKLGLELAEKLGDDKRVAGFSNNLGIFYKNKGQMNTAIGYYVKSINLKERAGDMAGVASTCNNLGYIYEVHYQDYRKARYYYEKSFDHYRRAGERLNTAVAEMNVGNIFLLTQVYDTALLHYQHARQVFEEERDTARILKIYLNLGEVYEKTGSRDSTRFFYRKARDLASLTRNTEDVVRVLYYEGKYWLSAGENDQGISLLKQGLVLAREHRIPNSIRDISETLMNHYRQQNNYDSALYYSNEYLKFFKENSLGSSEDIFRISESNFRLSAENRETMIKLEKQRLVNGLLVLISLMTVLLTVYIYRSYRNKQRANRLLAEMDSLKTRLYTNISHELRTPLSLILGPLEEMLENGVSQPVGHKTLEMMRRNAARLLQLVNQILDLSKLDAGAMKLELAEGNLMMHIGEVLASFSVRAGQKDISYRFDLDPPEWNTWYDPDKLEKIIINLLSNAFKYTPAGGKVSASLRVEKAGGKELLRLRVEDSGPGIPPEQLEKIFERFHQVEEERPSGQAGTGIGLALVRELADLMHGHIRAENLPQGGAAFLFEMPLGKAHLEEAEFCILEKQPAREAAVLDLPETEEPCILPVEDSKNSLPILLIVEDHADIREHIRDRLWETYQILDAADGEAGLRLALEEVPDIVVTDLMMPVMDGVEMTRRLKTDERTSHIPVVMLTAKASVENRIEGLETGADDYLTKPFHMKELAVRLQNLGEQRKLLREKFRREIVLEPGQAAVNSADERFLEKMLKYLEENLSNPELDVQAFRDALGMSRMQFFRKVKALSGQSPVEFIRTFRLKRAAQLLEKGFGNVAEVTYEVGFNNLSYFARCFKEFFGRTPSEYLRANS